MPVNRRLGNSGYNVARRSPGKPIVLRKAVFTLQFLATVFNYLNTHNFTNRHGLFISVSTPGRILNKHLVGGKVTNNQSRKPPTVEV